MSNYKTCPYRGTELIDEYKGEKVAYCKIDGYCPIKCEKDKEERARKETQNEH